jgi:acetyltransferase EpsM
MNNIILVGAGGHAAEIYDYIQMHNQIKPEEQINLVGIIDDEKDNYDHYAYKVPYLGTIKGHEVTKHLYLMGIANLEFRQKIVTTLCDRGAQFIGFIHPHSLVSSSATIGLGTVISHNVSVGPMASIGSFNVINSRATIGHDAVIGDFNFICPSVSLSGNTKIGSQNLLGTNVCTIPNIEIGNHNIIAEGMVIANNVTDNETIFYRYKEKIIAKGFNG